MRAYGCGASGSRRDPLTPTLTLTLTLTLALTLTQMAGGKKTPLEKAFVTSLEDEKKDILSKYDEDTEFGTKKADDVMVLDDTGTAVDEREKKQAAIRAKLEAAGRVQHSLSAGGSTPNPTPTPNPNPNLFGLGLGLECICTATVGT